MDYVKACLHAQLKSAEHCCTIHVCAVIGLVNGEPAVLHCTVSDWYDGSVVCYYTDGERHA